jgi:hypothetical protein
VQDLITNNLNHIGNVMNLQWDAQTAYNNIELVIQAHEDQGKVQINHMNEGSMQ